MIPILLLMSLLPEAGGHSPILNKLETLLRSPTKIEDRFRQLYIYQSEFHCLEVTIYIYTEKATNF